MQFLSPLQRFWHYISPFSGVSGDLTTSTTNDTQTPPRSQGRISEGETDMTKISLPKRWQWLQREPGPKMIKEALPYYGVQEYPGGANNKTIIDWSYEIDRRGQSWIRNMFETGGDAVAWCGLFMGMVAKRSGKFIPNNPLSALAWAAFGQKVMGAPELGDVLVFTRTGGGHVGLYVGEDDVAYYVLGGNQSDSVNITRILKTRLYSAQRYYSIGKPANVRRVFMDAEGPISENEA